MMDSAASHGSFQDILDFASPALRPVCVALRALVATQHADFIEIVWPRLKIASFGVGPRKMTQHYVYMAVQPAHINFGFYHGAALTDLDGLLQGAGKALRHVKLRDVAVAQSPALADLLRQAIDERMPYR